MMVTIWIIYVVTVSMMFRYLVGVLDITEHNKKANKFDQKHIKPVESIKFWIALITFAILSGIIFGGMWR